MDSGSIIALVAIGVTVLGTLLALVFKAGGINAKVDLTERRVERIETKVGQIETRVGQIEKDVVEVKGDIKVLSEKVAPLLSLVEKVDFILARLLGKEGGLVGSSSPRRLTERGLKVLEESGVKEIVEAHFDEVLVGVRSSAPKNAYQTEAAVIKAVKALAVDQELLLRLQDGAFNSGVDVEELFLVGAIYIRDRILVELNFGIIDTKKQPSADKPA